jgi:hypothetical protein
MLPFVTKENIQVDQSLTKFFLTAGGWGTQELLDDRLLFLNKEFNTFLFKIIHFFL